MFFKPYITVRSISLVSLVVILYLCILYVLSKSVTRDWDTSTSLQSQALRRSPNNRRLYLPGTGDDPDPEIRQKRAKIVEMARHAWNGYVKYAWGANELRPISRMPNLNSIFSARLLGATLFDAMDTLYLMGLYDEFQQGREWIAAHFNIDNLNVSLSVFEVNIRFIGGLLSCYALTGDELFKDKAESIAQKLLPAFNSATGLPYSLINLKTNTKQSYSWAGNNGSVLSEIGTLHMEFQYLSDITGNNTYREKVQNIRKFLRQRKTSGGLYYSFINAESGEWISQTVSVGGYADSFYEYLLKSWLQNDKTETEDRQMFDEAMKAIIDHLIRRSSNGLTYIAKMQGPEIDRTMEMLACFFGALLALGSVDATSPIVRERYIKIAEELTNTCHEAYQSSHIRLAPDEINFSISSNSSEMKITKEQSTNPAYILRPETLEAYFTLWRVTKNQKYRQWAWEIIEAIELYCKSPAGYSGISNVYESNPVQDDEQQTFFMAETLKYSYLLFSDESFISLDEWVFNTEAHPLPIKRKNEYYRENHSSNVSASVTRMVSA